MINHQVVNLTSSVKCDLVDGLAVLFMRAELPFIRYYRNDAENPYVIMNEMPFQPPLIEFASSEDTLAYADTLHGLLLSACKPNQIPWAMTLVATSGKCAMVGGVIETVDDVESVIERDGAILIRRKRKVPNA